MKKQLVSKALLSRSKLALRKNSPLQSNNKNNSEDFEFEIPKFLDITLSQAIQRNPFENELVDRNLDDLWFTIGHFYHENSPQKIDSSAKNQKKVSSHSNKKNNNLKSTENDNAFDIMEYILKNKKKSEVETKVNKSHHSTKTTEIIKQKSNPNKLILKRKISANLIKSNISCKKIPKETNFVLKTQKPEKVVMLKPNTVNKNNLSQKLNITSTSINVSKAINNIDKNKKSFRSSKSIPKPINQNKNEVINHNKSKSIYIPAMHSTREIRKWEKLSGKFWYHLNSKERLEAITEINSMISKNENL